MGKAKEPQPPASGKVKETKYVQVRTTPLGFNRFGINLGPIDVPIGYIVSLLIGLLLGGVIAIIVIVEFKKPSFIIDPVIEQAVSTKIAALPPPTPKPEIVVEVSNISLGEIVEPTGGGEYPIERQARARIEIKVPDPSGKQFRWEIKTIGVGEFAYQSFDKEVIFVAPSKVGVNSVVYVCEADAGHNCLSGGLEESFVFKTKEEE